MIGKKQTNVDSLANAAYEKWYAKNVKPKQDALEVKKFDDTYLKRDESLPVYNTRSLGEKVLKKFGYSDKEITGYKYDTNEDNPIYNTYSTPLETTSQRISRWVKNFGTNVKQYLDAHRDRAKKQSEIPMPRWGKN